MASMFIRFPGGKAKTFTMSYDDGIESDIPLVEMLKARGMKGTFNISSRLVAPEDYVYPAGTTHRKLKKSARVAAYEGMEVAIHGATHPFLEQLPSALCVHEILGDRLALEKEFGCIVRGMAYPFGSWSDDVLETLRLCGVSYARTTRESYNFFLPKNWLTMDPTCHHEDAELFELAEKFISAEPGRAVNHAPLMFCVWGHTYEFEQRNNWDRVEKLLDRMAGHEDVWYATSGEIRDYVAAYDALVFSADGLMVYNPSVCTVWFEYNGEQYSVGAGETLTLDPLGF